MSRVPRTDRRGALRAVALGAVAIPALAACDATDTVTPRSGSVEPTTHAAAGDEALVAAVARRITGTRAAAVRLAEHGLEQRPWALGLAALHQQHLRKLGVASGGVTARRSAVTVATLRSEEQGLQQALVAAAGRAESGALAQVLASMAAAIGQRLVSG